jgi:hypothetical protein
VAIVTLLSDFGLADTYVGQLKAAVLSVAGSVCLVDLTHAVPPQDVFGGAFLLWSAVETFPNDVVHVAVVDPGVGSARRGVAARSQRGDLLVGPDNGLLVPALDRVGGCAAAVELTNPRYWRTTQASTFHGRDIFGPVAGHLALGVPLDQFGPPVELQRPFELRLANGPRGQVMHIDAYGNLITNLPARPRFAVAIADRILEQQPYYAAARSGELLALVGSSGLIEISVRDGSAAATLGAKRGDEVTIEPR